MTRGRGDAETWRLAVGDIVNVKIIEVLPYACWGIFNDKICFTHVKDWSNERPVPDHKVPTVGEVMKAKVFHIANEDDPPQPADVTLDGQYHVDFAVSFALLETDERQG